MSLTDSAFDFAFDSAFDSAESKSDVKCKSKKIESSDETDEKMELMRMLEESRRTIVLLQKEKDDLYKKRKKEEQEEKEKEEQRQLEEYYKKFEERFADIYYPHPNKPYEYMQRLIEQLHKSGERVLFVQGIIERGNNGIIITNMTVYYICSKDNKDPNTVDIIMNPMYTFSQKLNHKYMTLIYNMICGTTRTTGHNFQIAYVMQFETGSQYGRNCHSIVTPQLIQGLTLFESIIRYIPGGYKNGHWKQLNGFYGMYLHEQTMELSYIPPALE
jgi:hypothetical protein